MLPQRCCCCYFCSDCCCGSGWWRWWCGHVSLRFFCRLRTRAFVAVDSSLAREYAAIPYLQCPRRAAHAHPVMTTPALFSGSYKCCVAPSLSSSLSSSLSLSLSLCVSLFVSLFLSPSPSRTRPPRSSAPYYGIENNRHHHHHHRHQTASTHPVPGWAGFPPGYTPHHTTPHHIISHRPPPLPTPNPPIPRLASLPWKRERCTTAIRASSVPGCPAWAVSAGVDVSTPPSRELVVPCLRW